MDFTHGADDIALAHSVFGAAGPAGTLAAAAFFAGTAAHDADDRIVYDAGTGRLVTTPTATASARRPCSRR